MAHGGAAPQVRARAAQRLTEQRAAAHLARLDLPPVADPLSALADIAAEVIAWKNVIAVKVNDLDHLRYAVGAGEQLRAEVAVWERALDRCERFLTAMARLNIDERLAKISEAQAEAVIEALGVACDRMSVSSDQRKAGIAAAARHLAAA